jgi:hypothetical protein
MGQYRGLDNERQKRLRVRQNTIPVLSCLQLDRAQRSGRVVALPALQIGKPVIQVARCAGCRPRPFTQRPPTRDGRGHNLTAKPPAKDLTDGFA